MTFVANFVGFSAVQKFLKSVKIWQSHSEFKGENLFFFETRCVLRWMWLSSFVDTVTV